MYNFCTLFDSNYLSRGLAMYYSLRAHCEDFHLYVFAFDDLCAEILKNLNPEHLTVITLEEFEDEKLIAVKPMRTRGEYCWTSTSSTILYVLEHFNVDNCTYLDSDLYFFSSPKPIFSEMGDNSILITEHGYAPVYEIAKKNGIYCVQFVTFKNDERGLKALRWWRERCLEWCHGRLEDGKYGDQKYLDDWTERFEGVHVLKHFGGGVAPWNVRRFELEHKESGLYVTDKKTNESAPIIFFHFHDLKTFTNDTVQLSGAIFDLDENARQHLYIPYLNALNEAGKKAKAATEKEFNPHAKIDPATIKTSLKQKIKENLKNIFQLANIWTLLNPVFWFRNLEILAIIKRGKSNIITYKFE